MKLIDTINNSFPLINLNGNFLNRKEYKKSRKIDEQNSICKKRKEFGSNNRHNAISANKISEQAIDNTILYISFFKALFFFKSTSHL